MRSWCLPLVWGSLGSCWLPPVCGTLSKELSFGTRSCHSTYSPPPRSQRSSSPRSSIQNLTTQKTLAAVASVDGCGLWSIRGGPWEEAAMAWEKVSAGSWHCQLGWLQLEGPAWRGGLGGELSHSASPKQSEWRGRQKNTCEMNRHRALIRSNREI